jgi:Rad3-related DNA helicase
MIWEAHFPFPEWRPAQAQGLDFILQALTEADDVLLELPTGIGKSAMAIALARLAASQGADTYITTTTIALENQYMRDFQKLGLRQLHAKSHYACPTVRTCDVGSRKIKSRIRCENRDMCSYRCAKAAFVSADFSIANSQFLLANARFAGDWQRRAFAIFDEAHLLHDAVSSGYSFDIHENEVEFFPNEGGEPHWLQESYAFWLATKIRELAEQVDDMEDWDPDLGRLCKKLERLEQKQGNLGTILNDNPDNWVFDQQTDRLSIVPLWASSLAAGLLPRIGVKRIYLSATMPGFAHQARYLGIDPREAKYLALPSPFPLQHRLVHICPVVKWPFPVTGATIAALCRALEKILALHPEDRGLVHLSSYPQVREVMQQVRAPWKKRLITHDSAQDKEDRLAEMFARPGAVLLSPSSHEGLDLKDDKSRFQVIAKLPFASLGDKKVKKRMKVDKDWYTLHTAQKFMQACGRSIRSDTDYATTYVLDAAFEGFYNRAHRFFPEYFLESLRMDEVNVS